MKPVPIKYDGMLKLTRDEIIARYHVPFIRADNQIKAKVERQKSDTPIVGKSMAALKVKFADAVNAGELPKGLTFKEWYKKQTGEFPNNHAEQCAGTFNNYVLTGLISEEDYDCATADWLQTAYTIANESKFAVDSASMKEAAALLKKRPGDTAKQLREMKRELKGQVETQDEEGNTQTRELTGQSLVATMRVALASTVMRGLVFAELNALVLNANTLKPDDAEALYGQTRDLQDAWERSTITDVLQTIWEDKRGSSETKRKAATAPVKLKTAKGTRELQTA